jgi:hypothetical protein
MVVQSDSIPSEVSYEIEAPGVDLDAGTVDGEQVGSMSAFICALARVRASEQVRARMARRRTSA